MTNASRAGFVILCVSCAAPKPVQRNLLVHINGGPTMFADAPKGTDIPVDTAKFNLEAGSIELISPRAGGITYRIHLPTPNPGTSYEFGNGSVGGECESMGKSAPLSGAVRLDEWTPGDGVVELAIDAWCTPEGFETAQRIRVTVTQGRAGNISDEMAP
jgi:hypothetical protein